MSPHDAQMLYRVLETLHDYARRTEAPEGSDVFHWAENRHQQWINEGRILVPLRGELDPAVLERCT